MPATREQPQYKKALYKTELCQTWAKNRGKCKYGENCQYAHGIEEIRDVPRHPLYKTELCFSFLFVGYCRYGSRCNFIHDQSECDKMIKMLKDSNYWNQSAYLDIKDALSKYSLPPARINNNNWNLDAPPFYPNFNDHNSNYTNSTFTDSMESFVEAQLSKSSEQNTSTELEPFTAGFTIAHQFLKDCKNLHLCSEDLLDVFEDKIPSVSIKAKPVENNRLPVFREITANKKQ